MVNAVQIQNKINFGYKKVAKVTGDQYDWFRPNLALAPIGAESYIGTIQAQFATDFGMHFIRPAEFSSAAIWFGSFNPQPPSPGDYVIGEMGTFYVMDVERFTAVQCIWCNTQVSLTRASSSLPAGASPTYWGEEATDGSPILTGWPASVRQLGSGMKMRGTGMGLPSDAPLPAYQILLPPSLPVPVNWNDFVTDGNGRKFVASTVESTPLGWRISAEMWPS